MKKQEIEGLVIEVKGNSALVKPTSHIGCDSSYCCQGDRLQKEVLEMKNGINAAVGDRVIYEVGEVGMLTAAFVVFVLPFIMVVLGIAAGFYLSEILCITATAPAAIGGTAMFVISVIVIRLHEKYLAENSDARPVITRKI